jgi:hypothetical protein
MSITVGAVLAVANGIEPPHGAALEFGVIKANSAIEDVRGHTLTRVAVAVPAVYRELPLVNPIKPPRSIRLDSLTGLHHTVRFDS